MSADRIRSTPAALPDKRGEIARQVIERAVLGDCWLTLQAVSEFYAATTRKGVMSRTDAAAQASDWLELFPCLAATRRPHALRRRREQRAASYWDALLATAAEGGCAAVLTEDMADESIQRGRI